MEEAPSGDRTHDRTLTKRMLYQLSYRGCTIHWLVLQSAVEKLVGMPASGLKQTSPRKVRRTRKALCLQEGWRRNGFRLLRRRAKSKNPATRNRTRDHLIAAALYSQMLYQLSYNRSVGKGTCSRSFEDALRMCPSSVPAPQIWNFAKKASRLRPTS